MAGHKRTKQDLNKTLKYFLKLLNDNNINNWFIGYGTLLGIIRDNSCIHGDDDIDIVMDIKNHDKLINVLKNNNLFIRCDFGNFLKAQNNNETNPCIVEFYMASLDEKGNFNDTWEKVIWTNCFNEQNELIKYVWNDNLLYLPFNYEKKLINRYGHDWKIPQNTKGVKPPKLSI